MQERRSRQRLPSIRVTARVGIKRGIIGRDWLTVRVLDFSNRGVAFTGDVPLEHGDRFQMSLRLSTETGDFVVEKATATISNIRDTAGRRIYGARFSDDNPSATCDSLDRIEGIVKRYKELSSRIFSHRSEGKTPAR
ncbi:PilZ domain-containing protein [Marinobacter lacisalsi]|uniref:PilZ domain-containing protein n=1 Tax=Marinobacter lacisalsi TaxID=475979 RepID=A0ABV8QHE2_9GAMM